MKKKKIIIFLLIIFLSDSLLFASSNLKELGIFTGRGRANLDKKDDYKLIPVGLRLGFDLKPLVEKIKIKNRPLIKVKGLLEFVLEPYLAYIYSPQDNFECGCGMLFKYGYRLGNFLPFIDAGTGLQYTTQHTNEEATQWCFQVQGGAGFYYFFKKNKAISFEYRFRHFSNASTKAPNKGVDVHNFLVGLSCFF